MKFIIIIIIISPPVIIIGEVGTSVREEIFLHEVLPFFAPGHCMGRFALFVLGYTQNLHV